MSHAVLSPSGASRWLACTPSARLEQQFPDSSGDAAKEGTLAHELGETLIKYHTKQIKKTGYNKIVKLIEADPMYNQDMLNHAEGYAAFVIERFAEAKKKTKDAVLQVESKLDLTEYVPESFGTGDAIVIADGILDIIDLKYGKGVQVSAIENKQMMLYGLGALAEYDILYDIHTVRMTIYQPRLDNISIFELPAEDLRAWGTTELAPLAEKAFAGEGEFVAGDHCRFCRAKAQCKALAEKNLELAKYDFQRGELLADDEISDILSRADAFKKWISAVEEYALKEAVDNGKTWPGYKLVEGRSNRMYVNQDEVAKRLIDNGIPEAIIYTKSLLGITAMEKAVTKKFFDATLSDLIMKPQGKPALVPLSDKRPALNSIESAIKDFEEPIND